VVYPVVRVGKRIRQHIIDLAETTIELLVELGVAGGEFRMEHPGVWLPAKPDWRGENDAEKIASIGIHVSRGITVQGLSLNVDVAPDLFGALVSCGMPQVRMTSVRAHRPNPPPLEDLASRWAELYARRAGVELQWSRATPP
jgi:lipoate-protein ligase B